MGRNAELKLKPLTPFKFYGDEAPRIISKDPKQVLEPLMEWAQKAHWKQGGLAGYNGKAKAMDPLPNPPKSAREYFFEERIRQLEMRPTREELMAMKPDLIRQWQALPIVRREMFGVLHEDDVDRFDEEMVVYKAAHPEYESELRKKHIQKKRAAEEKNFRKSKKLRRDAKVIYTEDEASSADDSDAENIPIKAKELKMETPKRGAYSGAFEFPLSPRSVRRFRREAARNR